MGSRYGEYVETFQFAVPEDNAGDGYAGSHALYQDVTVPPMTDGTSNTFMYAEKFQLLDGEHVLTTVQHAAGGEDSRGLWQINVAPDEGAIRKGGWICDVTHEDLPGGTTVAMETLTIAHEGFLLF